MMLLYKNKKNKKMKKSRMKCTIPYILEQTSIRTSFANETMTSVDNANNEKSLAIMFVFDKVVDV